MKNYFKQHDALSIPWVESPFFGNLLPEMGQKYFDENLAVLERNYDAESHWIKVNNLENKTKYLMNLAKKFNSDGFVEIDLELSNDFLQNIKDEIDAKLMEGAVKTQAGHFHYSDGPRIFEAWKWSKNVRAICLNESVTEILNFLYQREMIPFQTINFKQGSNQPLHSDAIHFHTKPERWVCGVWTALEDMTQMNGPLTVVPGSHKDPIIEFQELNMKHTAYREEKDNYSEYENFLEQWVEAKGYTKKQFRCKAGTALIWAANLVHGGSQILDPKSTRWSQATHYFGADCDKYYTPFYSDRLSGLYSEKDVQAKNIKKYDQEVNNE